MPFFPSYFAHSPVLIPISFTFYYLYLPIQSWHLAVNQESDDRTIYSWYKRSCRKYPHNYPLSLLITITINIIIKASLNSPHGSTCLPLHPDPLFCYLFPRRAFLIFFPDAKIKIKIKHGRRKMELASWKLIL